MTTQKLTPEEVLRALEADDDPAVDDDMAEILAMSPAARAAELRAAGVDIAEVHAKAGALYDDLKEHPGPSVAEAQPFFEPARVHPGASVRRIRPAVWAVIVVAAAAAAIPVGVFLASRMHPVTPVAIQ